MLSTTFSSMLDLTLKNLFQKYRTCSPDQFLKNRIQFEFMVAHISEQEIIDLIVAFPNKAAGHASIPLKFLKLVADIIAIPLCRIINLSFSKGVYG